MATPQDVLNAIAQAEAGDIGTYATLCPVNKLDKPTVGDTMSGSDLYVSFPHFESSDFVDFEFLPVFIVGYGTWKLCGDISASSNPDETTSLTSLWLRIA